MGWTKGECIGCSSCVRQLPELSCWFEEDHLFWDAKAAFDPARAGKVCPAEAFHVIGQEMSVEEVLDEVEKDRTFYQSGGGGLTVSGGEPVLQAAFTRELLREAGRRHIHRAIETCGCVPVEDYQSVLWEVDVMLTDIKCIDEALHIKHTGGSNRQILYNLRLARRLRPDLPILIRTPVIPGFNDREEEILLITDFVREIRAGYEMLRYHKYGKPKYDSLNRPYPMGEAELSETCFRSLEALASRELAEPLPGQKDGLPYALPYAPQLPHVLLEGAGI